MRSKQNKSWKVCPELPILLPSVSEWLLRSDISCQRKVCSPGMVWVSVDLSGYDRSGYWRTKPWRRTWGQNAFPDSSSVRTRSTETMSIELKRLFIPVRTSGAASTAMNASPIDGAEWCIDNILGNVWNEFFSIRTITGIQSRIRHLFSSSLLSQQIRLTKKKLNV